MKSAADIALRFFFAYFAAYNPYAALTNSTSVSAQYVTIDGIASYPVLAFMAALTCVIWLDIICNSGMLNRWEWITKRRSATYLIAAGLQVAPAFQVSKFLYLESATIYFITGMALWGMTLAIIDIRAAGRGNRFEPAS